MKPGTIKTAEDWERHVKENGEKPMTIAERIELAIYDYESGRTAIFEQTPETRKLKAEAQEIYQIEGWRAGQKAARIHIIESIMRMEGLIK